MQNDEISDFIKRLSEESKSSPSVAAVMREIKTARRRRRGLLVASAGLVAAASVLIATYNFGEGFDDRVDSSAVDMTNSPGSTPSRFPNPSALCGGQSTTFEVALRLSGPTEVNALQPYVLAGEKANVVGSSQKQTIVAVGPDGSPSREILVLTNRRGNWDVRQTIACLARKSVSVACGQVVDYDGNRYRNQRQDPHVTLGVGKLLGVASVPACASPPVAGYHYRGEVSPVTAFSIPELTEGLVLTQDGTVGAYTP